MLKAEDTIPLDLPLAIYITKDEPLEEVCICPSARVEAWHSSAFLLKYQNIVKIMKNKDVADKVHNELYEDM